MNPRLFLIALCVLLLGSSLLGTAAQAQTTEICLGRVITRLDFRNPQRISGGNLAANSVYRFSNVTSGVDARVRIDAFNNGASLSTIDNDDGLLDRNFQPELVGNGVRSADFTITFVIAGTATPVSLDLVGTAIDIDGDSASLREYAEFSMPFAEYRLNNPTRLSVNASGPSVATNIRFESSTNFTAPGIDPDANQNIAAVFYSQTSSFKYRIGTLGTGNTTRLTSLDFTCPNLPQPTPVPVAPQDFGDAPTSYGNPRHDIDAGIRMGATNTAETAPYNHPNANADTGDDGVTFSTYRQGTTGTATVNVTGAGGRLQAWFDWNGNGTFQNTGEQVALNVQDNGAGDLNPATGVIRIGFTVPANATTTQTFARLRWSTQADLDPSVIIARDGEVEDYAVTILGVAKLTTSKTSVVYQTAGTIPFSIPGNDVIYTITTTNIGTGPADNNSVFVVDTLPARVTFFNGDVDGPGPATGPVAFTQTGAGLTYTQANDLRYSNQTAKPTALAQCSYTPVAGYDPNVKHICINPKGAMLSGTPTPSFTVQLRTKIK